MKKKNAPKASNRDKFSLTGTQKNCDFSVDHLNVNLYQTACFTAVLSEVSGKQYLSLKRKDIVGVTKFHFLSISQKKSLIIVPSQSSKTVCKVKAYIAI